jgi:beta-mannanase
MTLTWSASGGTDPAAGYNVYVNDSLVSSTGGTSATVGSLTCGTSYTFAVEAYDAIGTKSAQDSTSASTSDCPVSPPPSNSSIYWGAWIEGTDTYSSLYGGTWGNAPWDSNTWNRYQQNSGKAPSIVHWGVGTPWGHSFSYWAGTLNLVQNRGALNLLDMDTGSVSLSSIASGSEDSAITTWAQQAAAYGHPFFLRLDWEMNGGWFSWGTTSSNQNTPADYVAAWRHIHDIFTAAGATNVTWDWCPNLEGSSSTPYAKLYPGDAYVDWTCLDGYNQGSSSTSFSDLYSKSYADLLAVAPSKPMMIGEIGSYEYGSGVKAGWISSMLSDLPTKFPQIKALVWFNWRINEGGTWKNWEIESSASSQSAWSTGIAAPYYAAASSFSMPASGKPIQPLP